MKNGSKLFLVLTAIACLAFVKPISIEPKTINVVIDAGHGGHDFGATSDGITEKQIVQQISDKIFDLNKNKNVVIHLTRNSDINLSLGDRAGIINQIKPDLVISLHLNSNILKSRSGVEMFVCKENVLCEKSTELATKLGSKLAKDNNLKINEIKNGSFFILKKSEVPAMIIELGYLSNVSDKKYLTDDNEQDKIAKTIVAFISELK